MKRLVEVRNEHGGTLTVEVDDDGASAPPPSPMPDAGLGGAAGGSVRRSVHPTHVTEKAQASFEGAMAAVAPTAENLLAQIRGFEHTPDQITLEFGLRMTAAAGVVLASACVEANFKIAMSWVRLPLEAVVLPQ